MAVLQGTTQHIHVWQSQLQTWCFSCLTTNQCPSLSVHPCTHQTQCAALLKVKITFVRMERNFASLQEKVYIVCIIYIDLCLWPFMIIVVLNKPGLDLSFIKTWNADMKCHGQPERNRLFMMNWLMLPYLKQCEWKLNCFLFSWTNTSPLFELHL